MSINPSDTTFYSYNANGAVSLIVRTDTSAEIGREEFSYTMGGLLKKFVKYNYQPLEAPPGSNAECFASTRDSLRWDWRYRYSPLGGREQKRLYYSPLGDSCNSYHRWDYYLRGAFGEQLAVYTGKQIAFDACDAQGRKVYMYPNSYLTNGGELVTKADGTREFSIADHLGSTRVIVDENGNLQNFDYKPFGEALDTNNASPRIGFIGSQQDGESRYFALGARMYDPQIGRFLSPDPLLEMFPEQSSYQYAYNSPLIWKDPSGLKGEKERGDRMMTYESMSMEISNVLVEIYHGILGWFKKKLDTPLIPQSIDEENAGAEGGGGSGGSGGGSGGTGRLDSDGSMFQSDYKGDGGAGMENIQMKSFERVVANWSSFSENQAAAVRNGQPINPSNMTSAEQNHLQYFVFYLTKPSASIYEQILEKIEINNSANVFYYKHDGDFSYLHPSIDGSFANLCFSKKIFSTRGPNLVAHSSHELFHLYQFVFKIENSYNFFQGDGYANIPFNELEAVQFSNLCLFSYYSENNYYNIFDISSYVTKYASPLTRKAIRINPKYMFPFQFRYLIWLMK